MARRLGEILTVYYCIDDYAAHPGMDVAAIQALDDHLTRQADVVFVAPRALLDAKKKLNPNVHFSPHGVDFDLFAKASDALTEPAAETHTLRHPIVGYFGSLAPYIDVDLLVYLAQSRPDWTFLFVGYVSADVTALRACPNVVLAGPKPYETLPRWAKAFDVAICPYQVNRQVVNSNPLKLREYLATGKPVVSVVIPESSKFAEVVYLASDREQYRDAIARAIAEDTPDRRRRRMDAVAGSSWDARFRETVAVVDRALGERT
jgi:glycosyltransferase involved in cell wall biosynthesis